MMIHRTDQILRYLWPPTVLLVFGFFILTLWPEASQKDLDPGAAGSVIDDPKITRTVNTYIGDPEKYKHPSKREPVDRKGIRFKFSMSPVMEELYRNSRGHSIFENPAKADWRDAALSINDHPEYNILMRVRGAMSAKTDRKSFVINLFSSQQLTRKIKVRKLFLLNLYADPYGFKNRLCFTLLGQLGLFPSYHQFAVVSINGHPQGLYLAVERPEDAIRRSVPDVVAILRQGYYAFETKYIEPGTDPRAIHKRLRRIHAIRDNETQAVAYGRILNLDLYLKWLAFNSLFQNGDSFGEIFWYEVRKKKSDPGRLHLMAWDYDDIQQPQPEESLDDPLMWGARNEIDFQITRNPILYARYQKIMMELLSEVLKVTVLTENIDAIVKVLDDIDTDMPLEYKIKLKSDRTFVIEEFKNRLVRRRTELLEILQAD